MSDSDAIVIPSYSNDTDKTDDIFNTIFKNNTHDCSKISNSYIYKCKNDKNKLVFFKEYIEHQLLVIIKLFNLNDDFFKFKKFITFLVILFILKSNDNDIDKNLLTELNKLLEKPNNTIENYFDDHLNDSENFKYFFKSLKSSKTDENYKNTYDIVINNRNNNCISNLYNELIFNINNITIQQNNNFIYIDLDDKDKIKIEKINICIHNNFNLKKTNKEIKVNQYESYISSYSYLYLDNKETPYLVQVSDNNIITLYLPIKVNDTQLILNIHTKEVINITNFIHNFISGNNRPIEANIDTWDTENYLLEKIYLPFEYNLNRKDIIMKTFIIKNENEKYKYDPYIFKISNDNIDFNYEYFLKVFYIVNNEKITTHNLFISYNYSKLVVYNSKTKKIFVFILEAELINTKPLSYYHRNKIYNVEEIIKFCNNNNNIETKDNRYDIKEIDYYYDDKTKIPEPTYKDPYFKDNSDILKYINNITEVSKFIEHQYNEFILKIHDDYKKNPLITLTEKEKNKKQFYFQDFNSSNPEKITIDNMDFIKIDFLYEKINNGDKLKKRYKLYNLYYCNDKNIYLIFVIFNKKYVGKFFTEIYLNDNYYYIDLNNKYIYNLNDFCTNFIIKYNNQDIMTRNDSNKEYFIYHKDNFYYKGNISTNINKTATVLKRSSAISSTQDKQDKKKTNEYKEITIEKRDVENKIKIDNQYVYIIELYPDIIMIFYNIINKKTNKNTKIFISYNAKYLLFKHDDNEFLLVFVDTLRENNIEYISINSLNNFTIEFTKENIKNITINGSIVEADSDIKLKPKKKFDYLKMYDYSILKDLFVSNQKIIENFDGIILDDNYKKFYFDGYADIIFYKINEFNGKKCNNIYISHDTNIIYVYIKQESTYKIDIYTKINKKSNRYLLRNNVNKFNYDVQINDSLELKSIVQHYGDILNDDNIDTEIETKVKKEFLSLYVDIDNDYNISYLTDHYVLTNHYPFLQMQVNQKIEIKYNDNNIYQIQNYFENKVINCYKIDKIIKYYDDGSTTNIDITNIYISLNAKLIYIFRYKTDDKTKIHYIIFYRDKKDPLNYYYYQNDGTKTFHKFQDILTSFSETINENIFKKDYYGNIYRESLKRRFVYRDSSDISTTANSSDFFSYNQEFHSFLKNNIKSVFTIIKRENDDFFQIQINNNNEDFLKITMFVINVNNHLDIYDCNNIYIEKNGKYILLLNYKHDKQPIIRCFQQKTADLNIYNLIKITNIDYNQDINDKYDINTEGDFSNEYTFSDILDKFVIENSEYKYHFDINDLKSIDFNINPPLLVGQAGGNNDDQDNVLYAIIIILINRILLLNKDEKLKLSDEISNFKF